MSQAEKRSVSPILIIQHLSRCIASPRAHALALYHKIPAGVYNLGSSQGHSVKQVIERAIAITGKTPTIEHSEARAGDPPMLTASADKFNLVAGAWQHHDLDAMIQHAWNWYVR